MAKPGETEYQLQSVDRAVAVLNLLLSRRTPMKLNAIAEKLDLSKRSTYRYLCALEAHGLVLRLRRGCVLGPKLIELGVESVRGKRARAAVGGEI